MIAAVLPSHEHHEAAARAFNKKLRNGDRLVIIGHTLVEAFAVLTRNPGPYLLPPEQALTVLRLSFVDQAERVLGFTGEQYLEVLQSFGMELAAGSRCYDRMIAACARAAKVSALLTFNLRHFQGYNDGFSAEKPH
jgi:predicted nucleic acid-binding protein